MFIEVYWEFGIECIMHILLSDNLTKTDTKSNSQGVQSPKKMGNQGTRFLRKVCESEEGRDEIFDILPNSFKS